VAILGDVTPALLSQYDVAIFLRPEKSKKLEFLVNLCVQRNIMTIADFDDLLFRIDDADTLPAVLAGRVSVSRAEKKCLRHAQALALFQRFTVSTETLAAQLKLQKPDAEVHCLPNAISADWLKRNSQLDITAQRPNELLYLPGTRSHDQDFDKIKSLLSSVLTDAGQSDLKLKIIGPLSIDTKKEDPALVLRGPEWVEFNELPQHVVSAMACLAPLARTPFNQCKSHIKFIEAAAFGTPLIASPIPDIQQHKVEGLFFPETESQWLNCIERLQSREYLRFCSDSLSRYVREHCSVAAQLPPLLSFYTHGSVESFEHTICTDSENTNETLFIPESVTITRSSQSIRSLMSRIKRKTQKLILSPRHFVRDSRAYAHYREQFGNKLD